MNLLGFIISGLSIIGLFICYMYLKRSAQYDDLYGYLSKGDPVKFYDGEEKMYGKVYSRGVDKRNEDLCIIDDGFDNFYNIHIDDLHPVFGYNYKADKE